MANTKNVIAPPNGKGGKHNEKENLAAYKTLQKQVADHLRMIDMAFKQYYLLNPHFPKSVKTQFDHWTLTREKGSTRIDVFFKENKYTNEKNGNSKNGSTNGSKKMMMMAAAAPEEAERSANSGSLPDIYTYDEVGAPPSGPKDPKRP